MDMASEDASRKRTHQNAFPGKSSANTTPNSTTLAAKCSIPSPNTADQPDTDPPKPKKPKLVAACKALRPLRRLQPSYALQPSSSSTSSTERSVPNPSMAPLALTSPRTKECTESNSSTQPEGKNIDTYYCSYCNKSIEGGEAGRRRHQGGEGHRLRVLRGLQKYVSPSILPCSQWRFPPSLPFATQLHEFIRFIDQQSSTLSTVTTMLLEASSEPRSSELQLGLVSNLDHHFMTFVYAMKPKKLQSRFGHLNQLYLQLCGLWRVNPLSSPFRCPLCEGDTRYSVSVTARTAYLTSSSQPSVSFPSFSPHSSSENDSNSFGEEVLQFWSHLASAIHRNQVERFWREHHIVHPSSFASRSKSATYPSTNKFSSSTKHRDLHHSNVNGFLFDLPPALFDASNYMLSQADLQLKLESWSRLSLLVQSLPESAVTLSTMPLSEVAMEQWRIDYPSVEMPPTASRSVTEEDIPLKDKIMRFMTPGEVKGERIGAKWAEAVKNFIQAFDPSMTSESLIRMARLERMANPHLAARQSSWFPSFGGVWNETTRADHKKTFFASQRPQRPR